MRHSSLAMDIVRHFQTIHAELTAYQMAALLWIARNPGCSVAELAAGIGGSHSAASRAAGRLSGGYAGTPGFDLVSITKQVTNRSIANLELNRNGDLFMSGLNNLIEAAFWRAGSPK